MPSSGMNVRNWVTVPLERKRDLEKPQVCEGVLRPQPTLTESRLDLRGRYLSPSYEHSCHEAPTISDQAAVETVWPVFFQSLEEKLDVGKKCSSGRTKGRASGFPPLSRMARQRRADV